MMNTGDYLMVYDTMVTSVQIGIFVTVGVIMLLAMLLFSLYQAYRPIPYREIFLPLVVPAGLLVWSAVDFNADRQCPAYSIFWVTYVIFLIISFSSRINGYIRYCRDNYSDISSRSIKWLIGLPVLLVPVLAFNLFVYGGQVINGSVVLISELSLIPAILYVVWYAHRQVPSVEIPSETADPAAPVQEIEAVESDGGDAEVQQSFEMFDGFLRVLEDKCNNERIFLNPDLTQTELARILNTNTTYVSRFFSSIGTNFNEYINGKRIEYACNLIRKADHPDELQMKSISLASGFSIYRTFARLFTEKLGVSPTI